MNISGRTKLCIIIGDPVEHSLSPAMHNGGYVALGIDDEFVFLASTVNIKDVQKAVRAVRVLQIRGLTCTMPHKIEVMKYLDEIDPIAQKIGAVNTVVNDHGVLKGYNTDWLGAVLPIEQLISLKGKRVALIGAGGAARACAYGIISKGAVLTIFNRTLEKAESLAQEFGGQAFTTNEIEKVSTQDVIVNATSLGMGSQKDETPVPAEFIRKNQIVYDLVYDPMETKLLKEAKEKGAKTIGGLEMLLHQGTAQFELYTGYKAPEKEMRKVLFPGLSYKK